MRIAILILLGAVFFVQKIHGAGDIAISLMLVLGALAYRNEKLPLYYVLAILTYLPFLVLGLANDYSNPFVDIKFQLSGFLFYFILIQYKEIDWAKFLFVINIIVFLVYFLLFLGVDINLWSTFTVGFQGRIYGPPVISVILLLFLYIINDWPVDEKVVLSFILGAFYILLTSNFMNLIIVFGLFGILILDLRNFFKAFSALLIVLTLAFFFAEYLPGGVGLKLQTITRPWEYGSVQTRLLDLLQSLYNTQFDFVTLFFGEGFGVSTTVYRINADNPAMSGYSTFLEIDNGFYYIFHRGGLVLFSVFLISHFLLIRLIPSLKGKLAFIMVVLVTNLLTIHYFKQWFYLLFPFFILNQFGDQSKLFSLKSNFLPEEFDK